MTVPNETQRKIFEILEAQFGDDHEAYMTMQKFYKGSYSIIDDIIEIARGDDEWLFIPYSLNKGNDHVGDKYVLHSVWDYRYTVYKRRDTIPEGSVLLG